MMLAGCRVDIAFIYNYDEACGQLGKLTSAQAPDGLILKACNAF
jgi:hypothetical protein